MTVFVILFGLICCQTYSSYGDNAIPSKTLARVNSTQIIELPPLEQTNMGIPKEDVYCHFGFVKVFSLDESNKPHVACVNPQDESKIIERGWNPVISTKNEKITLVMSTSNGTNPLEVGFFLNGSSIDDRKFWMFGNGHAEQNFDLLENQLYSFPAGSNTIHTYSGYVNIADYNGSKIPTNIQFNIIVAPNTNTTIISNFGQNEGILYQKDSDGFDISTSITPSNPCLSGYPCIIWKFGDDSVSAKKTLNDNTPNPFHQYTKAGILHGTVSVEADSAVTSSWKTGYWNFATLVLNSTIQNKAPRINVTENGMETPRDQWPANQSLIFQADNTPANMLPGESLIYTWSFGNNTAPKPPTSSPTIDYTYNRNGTYLVNLTMTAKSNNKITFHDSLLKTIFICPNPTGYVKLCLP